MKTTVIDLTGVRFGRQVVVQRAGVGAGGHVRWEVACDCGTPTRTVDGVDLRRGASQSCGCLRSELVTVRCAALGRAMAPDLSGQRFGRLLVVGRAGVTDAGKVRWQCVCDCSGSTSMPTTGGLRSGNTRSCGCLAREQATANGRANWKADSDIGYAAAHDRVYRARGRAADHLCACGAPAEEWAYNHSGIDERSQIRGASRSPLVFSTDPAQYAPMCVSCHATLDVDLGTRSPRARKARKLVGDAAA